MVNYNRGITEITCPCCGKLIPLEVVLSAAAIQEYIECILIQKGDDTTTDEKPWPVISIEAEIDTKELIENNGPVKDYHDKLVSFGMAEPLKN